jgi:acetate kinase
MSARLTKDAPAGLLIINSGSSSIRFSVRQRNDPGRELLSGKIDRIGLPGATFSWHGEKQGDAKKETHPFADHEKAADFLLGWLASQESAQGIAAVGHRIVHGGPKYFTPARVTAKLLKELKRITPYDPEHLRAQINLIEIIQKRKRALPQVACFDTAFHHDMPSVAKILPIPRKYYNEGIHRYGFHGLSYAYIVEEVRRLEGAKAARGRLILAHLGNGASLVAVRRGKSIDTTMAFTPAAGIPMSSRAGDLDPGIFLFLSRKKGMTPEQFQRMVNYESGLLGVSETSADMRDLRKRESTDDRAAEAVALFCYQVKKMIGAYAAALGGVDLLVFAGGIGENDPKSRAQICEGLEFLGIELDPRRNGASAPLISRDSARARVRVIRTNEELMIAKAVAQMLLTP